MNDIFDIDDFLGRSNISKKSLNTKNINDIDDVLSNDETLDLSSLNQEDELEYKELINKEIKEINVNGILESNGDTFKLKLNCDGENNEIINKVNKILESYNDIYNDGLDKLSNVGNKRYERLEFEYNKKLNQMKSELEFHNNQKIKRLESEYKNNTKYIESNIELKYKNKIDKLKNDLACYDQVTKIKLDNEIEKNIKLENNILELKSEISEFKDEKQILYSLTKIKTNQAKGIEGELEVLDYIKDKLNLSMDNENYISHVAKDKKNNSDLHLKYKKLNCVIEVKKHANNISKSNLEMFENVYILDSKYNCGIFISLLSEYSPLTNRYDFYMTTINDKPVIYISNVSSNLDKIIFSIKILLSAINNLDNVFKSNSLFEELKEDVNAFGLILKSANDIHKNVNIILSTANIAKSRINKKINNENIENEETKEDIIVNVHYRITSNEQNCIQCNYCNVKPYANVNKGLTNFIKHLLKEHKIEVNREELNL